MICLSNGVNSNSNRKCDIFFYGEKLYHEALCTSKVTEIITQNICIVYTYLEECDCIINSILQKLRFLYFQCKIKPRNSLWCKCNRFRM